MDITTRSKGDVVVLDIAGEIDLYNAPEIKDIINKLIEMNATPPKWVILGKKKSKNLFFNVPFINFIKQLSNRLKKLSCILSPDKIIAQKHWPIYIIMW